MDIIIGKQLQKLRKQWGNTQEDLANFLGISIQAVSKWERNEGYPDITLLPLIASFYQTTVDELLGCDSFRKQKELTAFQEEYSRLINKGLQQEALALCRTLQKSYPHEEPVMANLMNSLYMTDSVKNHQEIIDLATKLMKSDHLDYRNNAIQLLSFTYNIIGQSEKAKEYAKMLSYNEDLLIHVLRGQELIEHCQWYFWRQCDSMQQALNYLLDEPAGRYSAEERHSLRKWLYDLYHDVFHDGDFGFWEDRLARLCYAMAVDSINTGNKERSLTELAEMAEHCSKADSFNYIKHTSLLVNTLHYDAKQVAKSDPESLCSYFLKRLRNDCFQAIYKEPLFLSVQATLEQNNKNTPT